MSAYSDDGNHLSGALAWGVEPLRSNAAVLTEVSSAYNHLLLRSTLRILQVGRCLRI